MNWKKKALSVTKWINLKRTLAVNIAGSKNVTWAVNATEESQQEEIEMV